MSISCAAIRRSFSASFEFLQFAELAERLIGIGDGKLRRDHLRAATERQRLA